tara:strand:+ start:3914 stop:5314 length:1401 start_codon:yes stop_codon:yes gene_type:complete
MQIPILSGIYADAAPDFRTSYPKNLVPVPQQTGISAGYLRPADGVVEAGNGPGVGRGGINWNGVLYRVMGTKLVYIAEDNTVTEIGDVGGTDRVTFDYGFTYLAIASNNNLFLYDGTTLTQVTDPDLGVVLDVVWVDGYYMTTDGEFLVITDLADPFAVNPLKYGSSEADPDPIEALLKLRNEVYALNRYTIEVFDNVGTTGFPFQRIAGAQIQKGSVGTHACCVFMDNIAFMGGGRNEAPSIFMGANGSTQKIATREIEQILATYTETQLASAFLEERIDKAHQFLIIHLPNHTLVFDGAATQAMGQPVWFTLSSTLTGDSQWKAQSVIWVYDKWQVYNPTNTQFGYLDDSISSHWGVQIGWEFGTQIVYNESNGAIFHQLELIALTGHVAADTSPTIWAQHSSDGETWSVEKPVRAGTLGQRAKRLVWLQQGYMNNWRIQRFRGTSEAHISISRLEARLEPLAF